MKLILLCTQSSEDLAWCRHAVVDLSDPERKQILARREMFKMVQARDPGVWSLRFWGIPGDFYDSLDTEACLNELQATLLESQEWVLMPDTYEAPIDDAVRTDCDQMVVVEDGFYWKCSMKHTDVSIETSRIPFEVLL